VAQRTNSANDFNPGDPGTNSFREECYVERMIQTREKHGKENASHE
jgi:hypothetical protein